MNKDSHSGLQGLLFVSECIVAIKSIHEEIADWKYYIIMVGLIGHIDYLDHNKMLDLAITCEFVTPSSYLIPKQSILTAPPMKRKAAL